MQNMNSKVVQPIQAWKRLRLLMVWRKWLATISKVVVYLLLYKASMWCVTLMEAQQKCSFPNIFIEICIPFSLTAYSAIWIHMSLDGVFGSCVFLYWLNYFWVHILHYLFNGRIVSWWFLDSFSRVRSRILQEFVFFAVTSVTSGEDFASKP